MTAKEAGLIIFKLKHPEWEAALNDPVFLLNVTGWPIIAPQVSWEGDWVVKVKGVYDGVDVIIELKPRPFKIAMQKKR